MAKQELPVDFKDDVLQAEMAGKRKYRVIQNEDGTISLEDVTEYSQIGSNFGAATVNTTNMAVNESFDKNKVIDFLGDIVANEQAGYAAGALAVRELNGKSIIESGSNENGNYIKYGDGTLLMWGNNKINFTFASGDSKFGEFYVSRSYTRNFPVESLTPCSVQAIPYNNSYSLIILSTGSLNKKDFAVRLIRSGGSDFESIICWQAIGTWK